MLEYVGLDVSMEETSVCVLNQAGEIVWEGKVASTPVALARAVHRHAPRAVKVGLETGPLSTWLWHALRDAKWGQSGIMPTKLVDGRAKHDHDEWGEWRDAV